MLKAVRAGESIRQVAKRFRVTPGQVHYWVKRCRGQRLDRCDFEDRKRGPRKSWNRVSPKVEHEVLAVRQRLKVDSILGEYGAPAIRQAMLGAAVVPVPAVATISRILLRRGAVDAVRRQRRPPPPKGWYLPEVVRGRAEVDCFDVIVDLKIETGPWFSVLTATALLGGQVQAWPREQLGSPGVVQCLLAHWRELGLSTYAQFDNDTLFQGAHHLPNSLGRVVRVCLLLGVIPVFAPPREPGFQNAIEGFNALWQTKVWQRFDFPTFRSLCTQSDTYIGAHRQRNAPRSEAGPARMVFPGRLNLDLHQPLRGQIIFLRRTDANGRITLLGHHWSISPQWVHRLVRCEVNFDQEHVQFYALRRRDPEDQPLLATIPYRFPHKRFQGKP